MTANRTRAHFVATRRFLSAGWQLADASVLRRSSGARHRWASHLGCALITAVLAPAAVTSAATYYVRTDGGSSVECTGLVDAACPGSGSAQPCAWDHPFRGLPPGGAPRIAGGDTLVIGAGSYRVGYGAPETSSCSSFYPWDCTMLAIPGGPSPGNPTRFLGAGWDSGCPSPPELWGTERVGQIIDLGGSDNVEIACLDLTDHSGCVEFHSGGLACQRNAYPFGDWAPTGISAEDSINVLLADLDVHGFAGIGIHAGRLTDWTVRDVRVAGNGLAGWDGDIYGDDSNSGTLLFQRWTVEWNGCAETWPGKQPAGCWAQTAGGYGDGVGTGATQGTWIIEDSAFLHNTSDGLDLLYARPGASITIRRTIAEGNAGNQIKTNGPATIENSIVVGNCGFFDGQSFTYNVDNCRAYGNALSLGLWQAAQVTVVNSTVTSEGDCLVLAGCDGTADGTESVVLRNNIFVGQTDFLQPFENTCFTYTDACPDDPIDADYSVVFDVKHDACPGANDICSPPAGLYDEGIDTFDAHLLGGSSAIDSGMPVGGIIPGEDFDGLARPVALGVDRGAYERDASSPAPTHTPTLTRTTTVTSTPTPSPYATVAPDERGCRKQVRWHLLRLFRARLRAMQACHDRVNRGEATPPCPDAVATEAIDRAIAKVDAAKLGHRCSSPVIAGLSLGSPCTGASDAAALVACIVTATGTAVDALLPVEYSAPSSVLPTEKEQVCQATIASAAGRRYATKRLAIHFGCLAKRDRGRLPWCLDAASQNRLDRAETAMDGSIVSACSDALVATLQSRGGFDGTCAGAFTAAQLAACQAVEHDAVTDNMIQVLP